MPVRITKINGKYRVTHGGKVSAKATTARKAERQRRLLEGVERGWKPTGKPAKKTHKKKNNPHPTGNWQDYFS